MDLIDRVYRLRVELLRDNKKPTAVYVGRDEYAALCTAPYNTTPFTPGFATRESRGRLFDLEVYVVDADTHLRVV